MDSKIHHRVVVIGGGAAGLGIAARLLHAGITDVAIIEPSEKHYYQPFWTFVGGGVVTREQSVKPMAELIPKGATWIRDAAAEFDPANNSLKTEGGKEIGYDYLVVCPGLQIDWDKIPGVKEAVGKDGVCSNYSYDTVNTTWENIRNFKGGNAVFTFPPPPIKCAGAPQKIMYLAEDYFRKHGLRDKSRVVYYCATPTIFSAPKYAASLMEQVVKPRNIEVHFKHNLVELRPASKEAVFKNLDTGESVVQPYDMIHVVPPMSAPDFLKKSPLGNEGGWVDVNKDTLQHVRYPNVFSLGDASSLPTSKTAAAVRAQSPILTANLLSVMNGGQPVAKYDGYTSCPLITGYGKLILAEFDYDLKPKETFPFDQGKERYSMYLLKRYIIPVIYWQGLVKGYQWPHLGKA
ncbi:MULTISPECIES: FAD/NAD(P)-binding oxidoreductase [unclassified Methylocaldum]|jgi:sulfide:quinone oxidoreductase|uniref:NAD(P)/FAD-dependent oxidoreductase n=1 Tax=unclassified Methylocaldum TaxID=2622260 RepID=UPI000A328500|nr:FAD/NAD(P)-binding oxidoreductase [Methylocaldum sp. RMAD-M]MBP1149585.1 sulfide:quinone oxidoreductase [Methylocaldum sp. RMAD-M]